MRISNELLPRTARVELPNGEWAKAVTVRSETAIPISAAERMLFVMAMIRSFTGDLGLALANRLCERGLPAGPCD